LNNENTFIISTEGQVSIKPKAPKFIVEKVHPDAKLPTYGTNKAADCDLYSVSNMTIKAGSYGLVKTGLKMVIPAGWRLKLESRSGLAVKKGINIGAGVIDEDYRQEIGVIIFNHGAQDFDVWVGDKICQASVEKYYQANFSWGEVPEKDLESNRDGGFGSTGMV
jgi:deoxyuridine 5'-triphosphate nucleotidohydrolase